VHVHVQRVKVPLLGAVLIAATAHGVVAVRLDDDLDALKGEVSQRFPDAEFKRGNGVTTDAARAVQRYLEGGPDPDVPVVLPEAGFTSKVWREIARIPRGRVRSYGRIAKTLKSPHAARAVGQACGKNPVPLVIPCHRVIASDGSLGGFSAGLEVKRKLLALEGADV
jgi:AraC family transcriptional regulator of adaptative response/methylated-DNA-[protein]-cysteine methyltransferase